MKKEQQSKVDSPKESHKPIEETLKEKTQAPEAKEDNSEMSENEAITLLVELKDTIYWKALLIYNTARLRLTDSALRTIDPFKNPTQMAKAQGNIEGLLDMQTKINAEHKRRTKEAEAINESE